MRKNIPWKKNRYAGKVGVGWKDEWWKDVWKDG